METQFALSYKGNGQQAKLLDHVRCSQCGARQFDSRRVWIECGIASAEIIIKCWRCGRLLGLREA